MVYDIGFAGFIGFRVQGSGLLATSYSTGTSNPTYKTHSRPKRAAPIPPSQVRASPAGASCCSSSSLLAACWVRMLASIWQNLASR